jgi:hypothetical protein
VIFFFSSGQHSLAELQQKLAQLTNSQQQQQPIAQPGLTSTIQQLENNTLNLQVRNRIRVVILMYSTLLYCFCYLNFCCIITSLPIGPILLLRGPRVCE